MVVEGDRESGVQFHSSVNALRGPLRIDIEITKKPIRSYSARSGHDNRGREQSVLLMERGHLHTFLKATARKGRVACTDR
jgi:hypothetical protein